MLRFMTTPMHSEVGLVTFSQVLNRLPENGLVWRILDFDGVGSAPAGMAQEAFKRVVKASPDGYGMTWSELLAFAAGTEQTWECLIVGCKPGATIKVDSLEESGFDGCEYVIQAFDSTEWSVGVASGAARIKDVVAAAH